MKQKGICNFHQKSFQLKDLVGMNFFFCIVTLLLLSSCQSASIGIATSSTSKHQSTSSSLPSAFTTPLLGSFSSLYSTSLSNSNSKYSVSENNPIEIRKMRYTIMHHGKMITRKPSFFIKKKRKGIVLPLLSEMSNGEMGGTKNGNSDNEGDSENHNHSKTSTAKNNNNNNEEKEEKEEEGEKNKETTGKDEEESFPLPSFAFVSSSDDDKDNTNYKNHPYFDVQSNSNPMENVKSSLSVETKMALTSMDTNSNNKNSNNSENKDLSASRTVTAFSSSPFNNSQQKRNSRRITKSTSEEDDIRAVLKINAAFYRAINEGDINAFSSVWLEDDYIQYFSENQQFVGLEEISENNVNINNLIFGYGEEGSHGLDEDHDSPLFIRVSNTDVHINGLIAWVTCQEHRKGGKQKQKKKENSNLQGLAMLEQYFESGDDEDDDEEERFLSEFDEGEDGIGMNIINSKNNAEKEEVFFTTNIFRKYNGKWQMISHHSGSDGIPQNERTISTVQRLEEVLGGENTKISVIPSSALSNGFNNIQGNNFDNNKVNNDDLNNDFNGKEDSVEAILDQLKSAIEDKLEERNQAMDSYKDWLPEHQTEIVRTGRYYPDNSGLSMGRNPADKSSSFSSKRMNRNNRSDLKNIDNSNDDSDKKQNYSSRRRNYGKASSHQQELKTLSSTTTFKEQVDSNTNRLTKRTLSAIRRLFTDKRITLSQKRKLIHNVILCTSIEETSQVELAYELLVENALAGEENAMDEFADQCRIIAEDHRNGSYEADD